MSELKIEETTKPLIIADERHLLRMGFPDDNSGFAIYWNTGMIHALRDKYDQEKWTKIVAAIELSVEAFLKEIRGSVN